MCSIFANKTCLYQTCTIYSTTIQPCPTILCPRFSLCLSLFLFMIWRQGFCYNFLSVSFHLAFIFIRKTLFYIVKFSSSFFHARIKE